MATQNINLPLSHHHNYKLTYLLIYLLHGPESCLRS